MNNSERIGDWFQSLKGHKLYVLDPRPEDVDVEEIAHALAHICRFGGHVPAGHYSVAQHSVNVSRCVAETRPDLALEGLLHDAAEAYLGDVIRPLKRSPCVAPAYAEAEKAWGQAIGEALGLDPAELANLHPEVKIADDRVLQAERRDLLVVGPAVVWRERLHPPWGFTITPVSAATAKVDFLAEYRFLMAQRGDQVRPKVAATDPAAWRDARAGR